MTLESSLPTSVLKPRVGTVTDTNTLAMGFLPPILMLIFMQTVLLSMLTQFIYAPSISLLRYNVTHRCASTISTCPRELVPIAYFIPITSNCFQFSNISLNFFFYYIWFYVLQHKLDSFTFLTHLFAEIQMFLFIQEFRKNQIIFAIQEFNRHFGLVI